MGVSLVGLSVAVVFTFSPLSVELEATPTFLITSPVMFNLLGKDVGIDATAAPFLVVTRLSNPPPGLLQEELIHTRQWQALGWAYPILYAITRGDIFEPYNPGDPVPFAVSELRRKMWIPPPDMVDACPFLRINFTVGTVEIASCYLWFFGDITWR